MLSLFKNPFYRIRVALLLVPLSAVIAGSMVAVFARYPAEGVDVSYTSQEHVQDVAATIFSALGTRAEHLRAATTGWGDDPLRACTGVNETDAYGTRVTVLGRDGSIVCGEPVPEKRVEEVDWSLANGELQLSVPGAAKWFVFSTKVDTLLSRALGSEFAHRVVLIDAEGTTIGALVGNAAEPDTLETSVALVPGTNWRIALSEATARRSGGNPLPLMAGVVAIALVPFAVGHRSWGRDAVRLGDLAGQTVVVFDEQMNTRHAPANLDLGTCPLNLLRVLHAEDRERVVSTLATMPILTPVRCRIHGFEFPIDVVVLTRTRVPCLPWHRRGPASAPGRFLRTSRVTCRFVATERETKPDYRQTASSVDDAMILRDVYAGHADTVGLHPGDSILELVACADRWKIGSVASVASAEPGSWHEVSVRLTTGRVFALELRRSRGGGDGFLLRVEDVTAVRLSTQLAEYAAVAVSESETPRGRTTLETKLLAFAAEVAPGCLVRRVVGNDGSLRLEVGGGDGHTIDLDVRRAVRVAERLTTSLVRARGGGGSDLSLRREMALTLHDKVMQPVIWARLRSGDDPEASKILGELLTLLRNIVDDLRTPPYQERVRAAISDAAEALRSGGIGVVITVNLPQPLTAQEESLLLATVNQCYTNVLRHVGTEQVTTSIFLEKDALVARVSSEGVANPDDVCADSSFDLLGDAVYASGGRLHTERSTSGVFTAELRLPRNSPVRAALSI